VDTIQELVMFSLFAMYTSLFLPSLSWPFEDSGGRDDYFFCNYG